MRLLLDSHVLVWLLFEPRQIGPDAQEAIGAADSVHASTASLWELALRHGRGKFPHPPDELIDGVSVLHVEELPIAARHVRRLPDVDLPHRDPFDALLVAQALAEGSVLLTADRLLLGSQHQTLDVHQ